MKSPARAPRFHFLLCWFAAVGTGVDLRSSDVPGPALLQAVRAADSPGWHALLKTKPDLNACDATGNTALHFAALNHDLAAVDALLAAGAEADSRNAAEATPLLYGAGHAGIVSALLKRGANPNAVPKLKVTPLMAAVAHRNHSPRRSC